MSGSLKIKAILLRKGSSHGRGEEIRRFRLDEFTGSEDGLQNLLNGIRSIFKIETSTDKFTLSWKDEDDDMVQLSSNEELQYAVENMYDDTLRIYVTASPDGNTDSEKAHNTNIMPMTVNVPIEAFEPSPQAPPFEMAFEHPPHGPPHGPHHEHFGHHHTREEREGEDPPFMGPGRHGPGRRGMGCHGFREMSPVRGGMRDMWHGMGPHFPRFGRMAKGHLKHMHKKMKKMMKWKPWMMGAGKKDEKLSRHVPESFREWVILYTQLWYWQGVEATASVMDNAAECVDKDFPQWLQRFLENYHGRKQDQHIREEGEKEGDGKGEMLPPPEGLPPVYYRWLCVFVSRFFMHLRMTNSAMFDGMPEGGPHDHHHHRHHHGKRFGRKFHHGSHGGRGRKGCRRRYSSESESSDGENSKGSNMVPPSFRMYVRMSMKQLHKNKLDNPKLKQRAMKTGVTKQVQEFVEQILLEWHAKLLTKSPKVVAMEIMEGERSLPEGLEKNHFQWICRFLERWHKRHAGKCYAMASWSSGETSDDTSEEENHFGKMHGHGPFHHHGHLGRRGHHGFMDHHHHPYFMHPGMNHPCPPPPPPYPMLGYPIPPHHPGFPTVPNPPQGGATTPKGDMVDEVTEGVKKL